MMHVESQSQITLRGRTVAYTLRRSLRARRAVIRLSARGLVVVLPARTNPTFAVTMLQDHAEWVLKKLDEWTAHRAQEQPLLPPGSIFYLGRVMRVEGGTLWPKLIPEDGQGDPIWVEGPSVGRWLAKKACEKIEERVKARAQELGVQPKRITLRAQRMRWGSCSSRGALSFNWRLILCPPEVLDYVVVHELAHMLVPNHSKRFWDTVARFCPDPRRHNRWLRAQQKLLQLPVQ